MAGHKVQRYLQLNGEAEHRYLSAHGPLGVSPVRY